MYNVFMYKKRNVLLSEPKQILDSTAFLMYSLILYNKKGPVTFRLRSCGF